MKDREGGHKRGVHAASRLARASEKPTSDKHGRSGTRHRVTWEGVLHPV